MLTDKASCSLGNAGKKPLNHYLSHAQTISGLEGPSVAYGAIELAHEPFSVVSVAERGCSSHATELYGFGAIGAALPLAVACPSS